MKTIAIPLGGKFSKPVTLYALIDEVDRALVVHSRWTAICPSGTTFYAFRNGRPSLMHRLVLPSAPPGCHVDHINNNGLDNRQCNLRIATPKENNANRRRYKGSRVQYKGVQFRAEGAWAAQISRGDGKGNRYIGQYSTAESAAAAYDVEALKMWGPYAQVNFPVQSSVPEPTEIVYVERAPLIQRTITGESGYKGVASAGKRRWQAAISIPGERRMRVLGYFNSSEEAARAYNTAAFELWGPGAWLNEDVPL